MEAPFILVVILVGRHVITMINPMSRCRCECRNRSKNRSRNRNWNRNRNRNWNWNWNMNRCRCRKRKWSRSDLPKRVHLHRQAKLTLPEDADGEELHLQQGQSTGVMVLVPSVHLIGPEGVGGLLGDGQYLKEGGGLNLAAVPHKSNCCVASNDNNNKKKKKKERKKEREKKTERSALCQKSRR
jgi:hypothetical protein